MQFVSTIKGERFIIHRFNQADTHTGTRKEACAPSRDRFHLEDDDPPYYSTYICSIRGKLCAHLCRVKTLIYKPQRAMFMSYDVFFFFSLPLSIFVSHPSFMCNGAQQWSRFQRKKNKLLIKQRIMYGVTESVWVCSSQNTTTVFYSCYVHLIWHSHF